MLTKLAMSLIMTGYCGGFALLAYFAMITPVEGTQGFEYVWGSFLFMILGAYLLIMKLVWSKS